MWEVWGCGAQVWAKCSDALWGKGKMDLLDKGWAQQHGAVCERRRKRLRLCQ